MNTALFISGLGIGFFAAFIILMLIIRNVRTNNAAMAEEVREQNRQTLLALQQRNEIGRFQVAALQVISRRTPTLLDQYAMAAMQGMVGRAAFDQPSEDMMKKAGIDVKVDTEAFIAHLAYQFAAAMMKERGEANQPSGEL